MGKKLLVTGGCGFIGSYFIEQYLNKNKKDTIINVDCLAYSGNLENTTKFRYNDRYIFVLEDIRNAEAILDIFKRHEIDTVVHFAAESHVDNSITDPTPFLSTNIQGTANLLQAARDRMQVDGFKTFLQISTDEVYGSLEVGSKHRWTEQEPMLPRSPYSASKGAAEMLALSFHNTFNVPVTITRCSNNFGPRQHEEKFIPVIMKSLIKQQPIPVYGDGKNVRDWISVKEHCNALMFVLENGKSGETYNIGANREINNLDLVEKIIDVYSALSRTEYTDNIKLINFVPDRLGHDRKYSVDISKMKSMGWKDNCGSGFVSDLEETVLYYIRKFTK